MSLSLIDQLQALEAAGLVHLLSAQPDPIYQFRHGLVQETAYASLVRRDRQALHRAAGEALEVLEPAEAAQGELAATLAQHFSQAGADAQGLKYFTLAADYNFARYANAEAAAAYARAIELARRPLAAGEPASAQIDQLQRLYARRGRALELGSRFEAALADYAEMETLGRNLGDARLELAGLISRATVHCIPSAAFDPAQGQALSEQALVRAVELGDRAAEAKVHWNLLVLNYFINQPKAALAHGEQSLALAREFGLLEQEAYTLNDLARAYLGVGRLDRALATIEAARDRWRELGNLPMLADSRSNAAGFYFVRGEYAQAVAASDEAYQISRSIGNVGGQLNVRFVAGLIHLEHGDFDEAIAAMQETVRLSDQGGDQGAAIADHADLGWAIGLLGDLPRGQALAEHALALAEQLPMMRPWAAAMLARLRLMLGDLPGAGAALAEGYRDFKPEGFFGATMMIALAEAHLALTIGRPQQALERMQQLLGGLEAIGGRSMKSEALYLQGRALADLGQLDEAWAVFNAARAEAEFLQSRRTLWPILLALSDMAQKRGNEAEAPRLRAEARTVLETIAARLADPEARRSFLNLPNTRVVLE